MDKLIFEPLDFVMGGIFTIIFITVLTITIIGGKPKFIMQKIIYSLFLPIATLCLWLYPPIEPEWFEVWRQVLKWFATIIVIPATIAIFTTKSDEERIYDIEHGLDKIEQSRNDIDNKMKEHGIK